MGFIRNITGVSAQIDASNRNTDAQIQATKSAAAAQEQTLAAQAQASADQQKNLSARQQAEDAAAAISATPLATADVQLNTDTPGASSTERTNQRRVQYGRDYSTGVQI